MKSKSGAESYNVTCLDRRDYEQIRVFSRRSWEKHVLAAREHPHKTMDEPSPPHPTRWSLYVINEPPHKTRYRCMRSGKQLYTPGLVFTRTAGVCASCQSVAEKSNTTGCAARGEDVRIISLIRDEMFSIDAKSF